MLEKNSLLHHRSDEPVLPQQAHGEGRTLVVAVPLCSGWMPRSHFSSSAALLIKLYIGTKWKAEMKHPFVLMQQSLISSEQHYQICPSAPTTSAPLAEGSVLGLVWQAGQWEWLPAMEATAPHPVHGCHEHHWGVAAGHGSRATHKSVKPCFWSLAGRSAAGENISLIRHSKSWL